MELKTERLVLRRWQAQDEAVLANLANNRKIWINVLDRFPHPYTAADAAAWIREAGGREPIKDFALTLDGAVIGGMGFEPSHDVFRRTARVGFWLGEDYWGRGYAAEALQAVVEYAFEHFDLRRLEAVVYEWNAPSARVLEKAGFTLESRQRKAATKDGKTVDVLMYVQVR
jgi:[ribosomal protein S5]-alanine N-acetyltransferase